MFFMLDSNNDDGPSLNFAEVINTISKISHFDFIFVILLFEFCRGD